MSLSSIAERLGQSLVNAQAFVGFDGYVDRIQQVIKTRSPTGSSGFEHIGQFADLIQTLAGRSGQIEIVTHAKKIGGNGPILANALATLGMKTRCAGPLSDPIFDQMSPECERISLGLPATTHALEFPDGKVMLSEVAPFDILNWQHLVDQIGISELKRNYEESRVIAFVDWANLPHANDLWRGYFENIVRTAPEKTDRYFLFDLCDPTKRTADEIGECLNIVAAYAPYGNLTLGMNENEARRIYLALNGHAPSDTLRLSQTPDLESVGRFILEASQIPSILIHPTESAMLFTAEGVVHQKGRLVPNPKVLTGAGDNLNAGYCWSLLNNFGTEDCLLLSMAASGAYIQNGYSPTNDDLIAYIRQWKSEIQIR